MHDAIVAGLQPRRRSLPEVDRPRRLLDAVRAALGVRAACGAHEAYAQRLLAASCLSFERVDPSDPAQRFRPPAFAARRTLGFGYLSWVARHGDGRHGRSLGQRAPCRARRRAAPGSPRPARTCLGRRRERRVPVCRLPDSAFIGPHPCHAPGERTVDQLVTFVDLSPVFALRRGSERAARGRDRRAR